MGAATLGHLRAMQKTELRLWGQYLGMEKG